MSDAPAARIWTELDRLRDDIADLRQQAKRDIESAKVEIGQKDREIDALKDRVSDLELVNRVQSKLGAIGKWFVATGIAAAGVCVTWLALKK